jgi:hypothetical protein
MPRLPVPKRSGPQPGFWCTLAMKHLVGISTGALRPDRLWRDCIAAGGKPNVSANSRRGAFIAAFRARLSAYRRRAGRTGPILGASVG